MKKPNFMQVLGDTLFLVLILIVGIRVHVNIYKDATSQLYWFFGFFLCLFTATWIYG